MPPGRDHGGVQDDVVAGRQLRSEALGADRDHPLRQERVQLDAARSASECTDLGSNGSAAAMITV